MSDRLYRVAAVTISVAVASGAVLAAYMLLERPSYRMLGSLRQIGLVRAYLFNPGLRGFARAVARQDPKTDLFATLWDTNTGVLLSRRMFREVTMDGERRYAYRPNLKKLGFRTGASGFHWNMETEDTPEIRAALAGLETPLMVTASYDARGFRHVDPDLESSCTVRAMFLGDSFTDGLWVGDADTFVNVFGRLVRERDGVHLCPINAGVNGYGSPEEAYVLQHGYESAGRPRLVFVMFFANDVDADYAAVIDGTLAGLEPRWRDSLAQIARMRQFAADRGATLVLVAIPPAEQVFTRGPQTHYQQRLRVFAERQGIRFVSLIDALTTADAHAFYWDWDPHFTPLGHRAVAEALHAATVDLFK
jgi:lysophospholipase L1-like esterase